MTKTDSTATILKTQQRLKKTLDPRSQDRQQINKFEDQNGLRNCIQTHLVRQGTLVGAVGFLIREFEKYRVV